MLKIINAMHGIKTRELLSKSSLAAHAVWESKTKQFVKSNQAFIDA